MKRATDETASQDLIRQPEGLMTLRTQAMPKDANPNGDIFGGWVMCRWILAAACWPWRLPAAVW